MKILIVKLGAMGDVLRTTPLLAAYRRQYPKCHITWIVDQPCRTVLDKNANINELWDYSPETLEKLKRLSFDIAMNLDKEKEALDTIDCANAKIKQGFGWDALRSGVTALNPASEYAVRLGLDDDLKFKKNQKSYQEISYEQVELPFQKDDYDFVLHSEDKSYAKKHLQALGVAEGFVGINTGSGDRFAGKKLPLEQLANLATMLKEKTKREVLLLGGPEEKERNEKLSQMTQGIAINAGTHHSIHEFAALVAMSSVVITGDTIAMHIAIATKVPTLVYFGSTCHAEIELYGRGDKVISGLDCAPCYKKVCPIDEKCMQDMDVNVIVQKSMALL